MRRFPARYGKRHGDPTIGEAERVFGDMDFMGGDVRWSCDEPDEDMLCVEYRNNIVLYDGFTNRYIIEIIKDNEHRVPFARSVCDSREEMYEIVKRAVKLAAGESANSRPYYGGFWQTRDI